MSIQFFLHGARKFEFLRRETESRISRIGEGLNTSFRGRSGPEFCDVSGPEFCDVEDSPLSLMVVVNGLLLY